MLIETTIQIDKVSKRTLKHLVKSGRYTVKKEANSGSVKLRLSKRMQKPIVSRKGACEEEVFYKVYVPEKLQVIAVGEKELVPN